MVDITDDVFPAPRTSEILSEMNAGQTAVLSRGRTQSYNSSNYEWTRTTHQAIKYWNATNATAVEKARILDKVRMQFPYAGTYAGIWNLLRCYVFAFTTRIVSKKIW